MEDETEMIEAAQRRVIMGRGLLVAVIANTSGVSRELAALADELGEVDKLLDTVKAALIGIEPDGERLTVAGPEAVDPIH